MSRNEADREDLLREATALVNRIELQLEDADEAWVVGFRRNDAASVYVGAAPVFQFNTTNELRRGYVDGRLIKAESGRLFWLERRRLEGETQLIRTPLTPEETTTVLSDARETLNRLRDAVASQRFHCIGAVPSESELLDKLSIWLDAVPDSINVAASPGAI